MTSLKSIFGGDRMVNRTKKKTKIRSTILNAVALILIVAVVVLLLLWNRYLNKNSLLEKFTTTQEQEVYLLGTFHENHFNKWLNYSMEDILSVVENLQPDVVFVEAREKYFTDYRVMDGPIDMAVVYSYCKDNDIPVEMVDWWVVDNSYKSNTTNDKRDDMIFANIDSKLMTINTDTKILVVCGAGHYYEQAKRFLNNGFEKQKIKNKSTYFDSHVTEFEYPLSLEDVWEKRAYFYAYTYPEVVGQDNTLDDDIKAEFTEGNHDAFYNQQQKYCEFFSKNELFK